MVLKFPSAVKAEDTGDGLLTKDTQLFVQDGGWCSLSVKDTSDTLAMNKKHLRMWGITGHSLISLISQNLKVLVIMLYVVEVQF